jgi:hypothetical protein
MLSELLALFEGYEDRGWDATQIYGLIADFIGGDAGRMKAWQAYLDNACDEEDEDLDQDLPQVPVAVHRAVSDALGYSVNLWEIQEAVELLSDKPTVELQRELKDCEQQFESAGGRGVELADRIDTLRVALAARSVWPEG